MRCSALLSVLLLLPTITLADPTALRIGYVTDLTARGAFFGVAATRGARLAQKRLLHQGQPIELLIEDARGIPAEIISSTILLIEQKKVAALICDLTQPCSALSPKALAAGIPLVFHSPSRETSRLNPHAHRNFIDYVDACGQLTKAFLADGVELIGGLQPNLEFGELCSQGMKQENPSSFLYRYDPGEDLRSAVLEFRKRSIQAVVQTGYEGDFIGWYKQLSAANFSPRQGFVEIILNDTIKEAGRKLLQGSLIAGFADLPPTFAEDLRREIPGPEDKNTHNAAFGYNALMALHYAFKECPDRNLSCLDQQLGQTPAELGVMGFHGTNNSGSAYALRIKRWENY